MRTGRLCRKRSESVQVDPVNRLSTPEPILMYPLWGRITTLGSAHHTALKDSPEENSPQSFQVQTGRPSKQCHLHGDSPYLPLTDSRQHSLPQSLRALPQTSDLSKCLPSTVCLSFCPLSSLPSLFLTPALFSYFCPY